MNGVEIARWNMPSGTATYTTLASSLQDATTRAQWMQFDGLDARYLAAGFNNVMAVELHQSTTNPASFGFWAQAGIQNVAVVRAVVLCMWR